LQGKVAKGSVEMDKLNVKVVMVRSAGKHEADMISCFYTEEDISGEYEQINAKTLYSPVRSLFLELSRELMAAVKAGEAIRVSAGRVS
jgi:hypothetical protein